MEVRIGIPVTWSGVTYSAPDPNGSANNFVEARGQGILLPRGNYQTLLLISVSHHGPVTTTISVRYSKDAAGKGLFERALKKLGPLGPDEIYGFEPALVAGGTNQLENLDKVNLFVHLTLLRQLAGPTIPFAGVQVR